MHGRIEARANPGGGAAFYDSVSGGSNNSSETKGIFHAGFDLAGKISKAVAEQNVREMAVLYR